MVSARGLWDLLRERTWLYRAGLGNHYRLIDLYLIMFANWVRLLRNFQTFNRDPLVRPRRTCLDFPCRTSLGSTCILLGHIIQALLRNFQPFKELFVLSLFPILIRQNDLLRADLAYSLFFSAISYIIAHDCS